MTINNIREALNKVYKSWELQAETFRKYNVSHDFFDEAFATMTFIGQLLVSCNMYDKELYESLWAEAKAKKNEFNAIVRGETNTHE